MKRNAEIMLLVNWASLAVHLFYVVIRYFVFNSSFSRFIGFVYLLLAALDAVTVYMLNNWSADVDLTDAGLVEYMRDIVYFSWIILVLALFSDYAFILVILIPIFVAYRLMNLMPASMPGMDANENESSAKRQKSKKVKPTISKEERRKQVGGEYRGGKRKF